MIALISSVGVGIAGFCGLEWQVTTAKNIYSNRSRRDFVAWSITCVVFRWHSHIPFYPQNKHTPIKRKWHEFHYKNTRAPAASGVAFSPDAFSASLVIIFVMQYGCSVVTQMQPCLLDLVNVIVRDMTSRHIPNSHWKFWLLGQKKHRTLGENYLPNMVLNKKNMVLIEKVCNRLIYIGVAS